MIAPKCLARFAIAMANKVHTISIVNTVVKLLKLLENPQAIIAATMATNQYAQRIREIRRSARQAATGLSLTVCIHNEEIHCKLPLTRRLRRTFSCLYVTVPRSITFISLRYKIFTSFSRLLTISGRTTSSFVHIFPAKNLNAF